MSSSVLYDGLSSSVLYDGLRELTVAALIE